MWLTHTSLEQWISVLKRCIWTYNWWFDYTIDKLGGWVISRSLLANSWTPCILILSAKHCEIWTNWLVKPLPAPHSMSLYNMIHFGLINKPSGWFFSSQPPTTMLFYTQCFCPCRQPHLAQFSVQRWVHSKHPAIDTFLWNMLNIRQKTQARRWKKQHFVFLNIEMKYKHHSPGEKSDKAFLLYQNYINQCIQRLT